MARLDTSNHDRYAGGLRYVYPVVSRRARGVSVGINLSPNDACNWRCVYCQVPGLTRGKGPAIDLERLAGELGDLLDDVVDGDFMERQVPEGSRRLNDLAFSGNGEPTGSPDFPAAVELAAGELERRGLVGAVKLVLITNGSLVHKPAVGPALERLASAGGEVWFKLDAGTDAGLARMREAGALLRELRRRAGMPLPELVRSVEQALRLDIEVAAKRPHAHGALDAFAREVQAFTAADERGSLEAFLTYLDVLEAGRGPDVPEPEPEPGWVQVLTMHASKGLEWDVVALPRLAAAKQDDQSKCCKKMALPYQLGLVEKPGEGCFAGQKDCQPIDCKQSADHNSCALDNLEQLGTVSFHLSFCCSGFEDIA